VLGQGFDFLMERGAKPETLAEIKTAFQGGRRLSRRSTTAARMAAECGSRSGVHAALVAPRKN